MKHRNQVLDERGNKFKVCWKQWHENTSWIIDAQCAGCRCKFGLLSMQLHTHTPPLCTWQHPTTGQAVQFWRGIPSPKMGLCWGGGGLSSIPTRHVLHLTWSHRPYLFWWISAIRQMMSEPCTLTLLVLPPSSSLMVWWCPAPPCTSNTTLHDSWRLKQ